MSGSWVREDINYWNNKKCPRDYLERALINLVYFVEGEEVTKEELAEFSEEKLRCEVGFYEEVADK